MGEIVVRFAGQAVLLWMNLASDYSGARGSAASIGAELDLPHDLVAIVIALV
jgi:hypothetical protein